MEMERGERREERDHLRMAPGGSSRPDTRDYFLEPSSTRGLCTRGYRAIRSGSLSYKPSRTYRGISCQ